MAAKAELLNKTEIAERFGVEPRSIELWVAAGMPRRSVSGRPTFAWHDCRKWREDQIRNDERAKRHAGGDEDRAAKMAEAKLQRAQAEAEESQINLAIKRGSTVPREFMRTEFARIATSLRARLLTFPTTWAPRLGACVSTAERQVMLQDGVNDMMPDLAELTKGNEIEVAPVEATA